MKTLTDFLNMGGYGTYVWSAYGICTAIMIWNLLHARRQAQRIEQHVKQRLLNLEDAS